MNEKSVTHSNTIVVAELPLYFSVETSLGFFFRDPSSGFWAISPFRSDLLKVIVDNDQYIHLVLLFYLNILIFVNYLL